ncbi:MAG: tetratricopeptide repeat protein [Natronospirillum sp.]
MYETEQEQIEAIKKWFSTWGNYLIGGVLVIILGYGAGWFYMDQQRTAREAASDQYQLILRHVGNAESLGEDQREQLDELVANLAQAHPDSTYTTFGALLQARFAAVAGDFQAAEEHLRWALAQNDDAVLGRTVNLRLARVQFAQGNHDAVLATLDSISPGTQLIGYNELRGDVYAARGDRAQAREAYASAWNAAQEQGLERPLLQVKAENYGVL